MTTTPASLLTRDRVAVFASAGAPAAAVAGAATAGWHRLTFTEQPQQETEWCWDASTLSVHAYYDPDSRWTQCSFAGRKIGRTDCCAHPDSGVCNQPNYPDEALTLVGNFAGLAGPLAMPAIATEIDGGRPVGVRIGWAEGGGHNPVIVGYRNDTTGTWVAVADPWYGPSDVRLATFTTAYQGSGSWTDTYRTSSARLRVGNLTTTAKGTPSLATRDTQTLDVFAVNAAGAVQSAQHVEGAASPWRAWSPLAAGRATAGAPVGVVSRAPGTLDVVSVGTDGHVYASGWWPGAAAWRPWTRIGTLTVPAMAAVQLVSRGASTMEAFVVDGTGAVQTAFWSSGSGWHPWSPVHAGRAAAGAPVPGVSRTPGIGDVFVLGTDRYVYTSSRGASSTSSWGPWTRIGTLQLPAGATVHAASRSSDSIDVAATDAAGVIHLATWTGGTSPGWSAWSAVPGSRASAGAPVTLVPRAGGLDLFVVWYDGHVATTRWQPGNPGTWSGWTRISRQNLIAGAPVAAVARTPTSLDVVFVGVDGSVNAARWAAGVADGHWRG